MGGFWVGLDLLTPLTVHRIAFGKGLEGMPFGLELLRDSAHHAGHILLSFISVGGDDSGFFSDLAEATQKPGLAHAALSGDVDDKATAGIINLPAQVATKEG